MAKYLAQMIVLGTQVVGKAFARALKQELEASQRLAKQRSSSNQSSQAAANSKLGMSLAEACEILNVDANQLSNKESLERTYKHLFAVNDKAKGGSFYLQSKRYLSNMRLPTTTRLLAHCRFPRTLYAINLVPCRHFSSIDNSKDIYEEAFTDENIQKALSRLQRLKLGTRHQENNDDDKRRPAAIFIPLCRDFDDQSPAILLTRRSFQLRHNKGDVCFPGGFEEEEDKDGIEAAVRETIEEIGTKRDDIKVYGNIPPIHFRDNIHLHPVFGFIDLHSGNGLKLNEDEVDSVHTYKLQELCDEKNWYYTQFSHGWTLPVFKDRQGRHPKVWGMTSILLYLTINNLMPRHFQFDSSFIGKRKVERD